MIAPAPRAAPTRRPRWPYVSAGLAGAGISLVVLLQYGGAAGQRTLPGLPDPGPVTTWALPAAQLGRQLFAATTVGLLLAAVFLSPRNGSELSAAAYRRLRAAGWAAFGWAVCALANLAYTLSNLVARPLGELSFGAVVNFGTSVTLGQSLLFTATLAVTVAVICRFTLSPGGALTAFLLAVLAVMPAVFTGHAASAGDHQLAVSAMLLHAVPVTLWAGGLLALAVTDRGDPTAMGVAVRRFSVVATLCLVAVAGSGVVSAAVRLGSPGDLLGHRYGQLVLLKTVILLVLAAVGLWQRRASIPALQRGDRRVFARVTVVEIVLFGLAMGTAVALARSPAPPRRLVEQDLGMAMLGFPMPPPMTPERLLGYWMPDPLFIAVAVAAVGLYLAGVIRLRRRGDRWPAGRTVAFLAGWAVIVVATSSGLARYGPVLFSVHMVQHLLVALVAPILLALSGPVTLALRALRKNGDPAWPGPREWLLAALRLPFSRFVTHPLFALAFYVVSMYTMYLTKLFELALRSHAAHLLMMGHFLLAGYLFYWVVIGVDAAPRRGTDGAVRSRLSPPVAMLLVIVSMVLHAFLGIIIMQSTALFAHDWYTTLPRTWGADPLDDQYVAGAIAWTFGEIPSVLVAVALCVQWLRADEREQRRLDRAADRAEAEGREDEALAAYNAMLAELAARERRTRP